jgi:hypothetical protein
MALNDFSEVHKQLTSLLNFIYLRESIPAVKMAKRSNAIARVVAGRII